jgi:hypothetical protein
VNVFDVGGSGSNMKQNLMRIARSVQKNLEEPRLCR